ncbi:glycosyltransferase family 2 protein [Flavobacterium psychrophilum]|uniref:glycosyltransferase family 2 protein n=1 Tax=Flavobacterium psychrophilum TaxID=96345 RepID=UPI001886CC5F|nr:glycosyltransferase family 2 protein [Flavobacterium psychrophilum]MBF2091522.1 glycosyltransferase family 2 protein [Flavobacterium psychrophilum]
MKNDLAIVIPYYKINFFKETLDSLASQTNKNFKVYIGNDASLDNPWELLSKYQGDFDFEYHEFQENLGGTSLVNQWHRCVDLAKKEQWLMLLCDDDTISENYIEAFYNHIKEVNSLNVAVVRYASQVIDENNIPLSVIVQHPKLESAINFLFRKLKGGSRSTLSEYIFKREMVLKVRFKNLPLAWFSDLLGVLEFSEFKNIYTINEALLKFRLSGINITSKTDDVVLKNEATFQFYYYLLTIGKKHFNKYQISVLLNTLENTFFNNKKNTKHWLLYTKLCFLNLKISRYIAFINRIFITVVKKI